MSMTLVFTQILIILLYVAVGYAAGKLRLIDPEQRRYLTHLCSDLILPFTILSASSQEVGGEGFAAIGIATVLMFLIMGGTLALMLGFHRLRRSPDALRAATTSLISFPNLTFLGLPLCKALFGDIAVLYNASCMMSFNVLFFTVQSSLFTGKRAKLSSLLTVPLVSTVIMIVMLALKLHFPDPVQTAVSSIGSMITPLSLMIIGVMMSENHLIELLKEKRAYIVVLLRNLVIPLIAMLVLLVLPLQPRDKLCVLVYMACPCATLTTIYSIQTDKEPELCARSVLLSTVAFAATLPVIIAIGQRCLGV